METIASPYRVALCDAPSSLPSDAKIAAETRYARELERAFGSPEEVAAAFRLLCSLDGADVISAAESAAVERWRRATDTARERALSSAGDVDEAYFDVRLG